MTGGGHWPTQLFKANQFNDYDVVLQLQNKAKKTILARTDGAPRRTKARLAVCARLNEIMT
jgi:hypothetical protein